jgi:hypothetical protein
MHGFLGYKLVVRSRFTASLGLLRSHTWIGGPRYQKQTFGLLAAKVGSEPNLRYAAHGMNVRFCDPGQNEQKPSGVAQRDGGTRISSDFNRCATRSQNDRFRNIGCAVNSTIAFSL